MFLILVKWRYVANCLGARTRPRENRPERVSARFAFAERQTRFPDGLSATTNPEVPMSIKC
ncbi:MAG: hypothetical protein DWI22_10970 [Planctomycetota bacterium]|nr:MAG: hypothetical protein DWI22_10970 [Planctomycetota bacterium]